MLNRRYDLRHLRAFQAVAEALHFGDAAQRLGIAQPAVSRAVHELETALELKLLHRTTRRVELTDTGRAFLHEIEAAMRQIEHAENIARETEAGIIGTIRVAYMDFAINGRLPELLRAFGEARPNVRLDLNFVPTTLQQKDLLEGRIDVGFLIGKVDSERVLNHPFQSQRYVALLPAEHPLANAREVTLRDLEGERFVFGTPEFWTAHRNRVFTLCHQAGFFPRIVQEASTSEGIFGLVAAGVGVSIYADCVRNLQRRGLVFKYLSDVTELIPTYAVWNRQAQSPSVRAFTGFLQSAGV